jgi:phosphatidylinositol kinase/protein kinase (PI-3  family)
MNSLTIFPTGSMFDNSAQAFSRHFQPFLQQRLLFGFLVRSVFSAEPTKLIKFQTTRCLLLVFGRGIVLPLTISTSQMNYISHSRLTLNGKRGQQNSFPSYLLNTKISKKNTKPTIGFEPMASSLPRKCSTPELRGQDLYSLAPLTKNKVERETGLEPATLSLEG